MKTSFRPWTQEDINVLLSLRKIHTPAKAHTLAAKQLNRTVVAVTWKYSDLKKRKKLAMTPKITSNNRNQWSEQEEKILLDSIGLKGVGKGITLASGKIGRTIDACRNHWYLIKDKADIVLNTDIIQPSNNAKVVCHNGTSISAQIILQKEKLIVAKYKDIVITIEL